MVDTVYLDEALAPNAATPTDPGSDILLLAGLGGATSGNGGGATLKGGASPTDGAGGDALVQGGQSQTLGSGGAADVRGGGAYEGNGGGVNLSGGSATNGNGGGVSIAGGAGADGGSIFLTAGDSNASPNGNGGDITLSLGSPQGSGAPGHFMLALEEFADDAAAATGGIPISGWYRTASGVVHERIA